MSKYLVRVENSKQGTLRYNRAVLVIGSIIFLFMFVAAVPLVQARQEQIPRVEVHEERRGVTRFEEYIALSPALGLPPGSFYKVNVYAFSTKEGVVLIDSGAEDLYPQLIEKIGKRFNNTPIAAVLLTHGHADHASAGRFFVDQGVPVYAPIGDEWMVLSGLNFPGVPEDFSYTPYTPSGLLYGGEEMFGLKVIPTPGHTPGSVSFLGEKKGFLFSGDATMSYSDDDKGDLDMTFELEYMTLQMSDNFSLQTQLYSLDVLSGLAASGQVSTILPGHNEAYYGKDVQPYIQDSIDVVTQVLMMR